MEYQAKELFAKHGVVTTLGTVVDRRPRRRGPPPRSYGGVSRRQGAGQGRRPRQGRRRQAGQDARRGLRARVEHPRHGDQGPDRQPGADHPGDAAGGGVLLLLPARPVQPPVPLHRLRRGRRRDRGGRQDQPRRGQEDRDRPGRRRRRGQGPRDRDRGQVPRAGLRAGRHDDREALHRLRRGGRDAGRGQPARAAGRRQARGARRQGVARRQRLRGPPPRPRGVRDQGRDRPARGQGQGQGPQLRQARRRRSASSATARAWSCRRSTSSRTPGRRTVA